MLYSKYKPLYSINPQLEQSAHGIINAMGGHLILEGAMFISGSEFRLFWRDNTKPKNQQITSQIFNLTDNIKTQMPKPDIKEESFQFEN